MGVFTHKNKPFTLSAEEVAKYKAINATVAGLGKKADAKKAAARIEAACAQAAKDSAEAYSAEADAINVKDAAYVGIVLGGYCSGGAMVDGELQVHLADVVTEEPRVVAAEDEEADDERSLWGDGDEDPSAETDA
jgi:hypothetical protein